MLLFHYCDLAFWKLFFYISDVEFCSSFVSNHFRNIKRFPKKIMIVIQWFFILHCLQRYYNVIICIYAYRFSGICFSGIFVKQIYISNTWMLSWKNNCIKEVASDMYLNDKLAITIHLDMANMLLTRFFNEKDNPVSRSSFVLNQVHMITLPLLFLSLIYSQELLLKTLEQNDNITGN